MPAPLRLLCPALAAAALSTAGFAAEQISPFMPPASALVSTAPTESLEFAGFNAMANKTYVNVYDKTTKKSRWIAVGETEKDITVLAFDARREQIVIKTGAGQKNLTLRKATGTVNAPTPVAAMPAASGFAVANPGNNIGGVTMGPTAPGNVPVAVAPAINMAEVNTGGAGKLSAATVEAKPDAPAKPLTVARQEEEARMLVSDLLEIGMAQRKAYEEAQKKAAQQTEQTATPPPATAPGT